MNPVLSFPRTRKSFLSVHSVRKVGPMWYNASNSTDAPPSRMLISSEACGLSWQVEVVCVRFSYLFEEAKLPQRRWRERDEAFRGKLKLLNIFAVEADPSDIHSVAP